MAIPSIYINLEDDVEKVVARLKRNPSPQVILVFPKRSFLFSDKVNLKLLKNLTDLLRKEIFILTMDQKGQLYAQEAGFTLKFLPKLGGQQISDVKFTEKKLTSVAQAADPVILESKPVKQSKREIAPPVLEINSPAPSLEIKTTPIVLGNSEVEEVEQEVQIKDVVFPQKDNLEEPRHIDTSTKGSRVTKLVILFSLTCVLLLLVLNFVVLPKASVLIYPKTEPITRDLELSLSQNNAAIDVDKLLLPAQSVSETVSASGTFTSQGKNQVGNKAEGTVKIYNFTKLPINLKAQTTILTLGGKNYNLVNDISGLKPTTYKDPKTKEVDQASLGADIDIIASQGGDDFNLPAGTRLEISNQVFGSKPQLLYAVTSSEITGGTTRYLSVITASDISAAKSQLADQALAQLRQKLSSQNEVLADNAFNFNVSQFSTDNSEGAQSPSFNGTLSAQVSGLSFKQNDLNNLITKRISENLSEDKKLQPIANSQMTYTVKSLDQNSSSAILSVHYQGNAVYNIDVKNLAPQLVGKSQDEVNAILQSKAAIDKVEITLAPAWQKNFPWFSGKISLQVIK